MGEDQGAREALVERVAERLLSGIRDYMGIPDADVVWNFSLVKAAGIQAEEVASLVEAEVVAAVSEAQAEIELLRDINRELVDTHNTYLGMYARKEAEVERLRAHMGGFTDAADITGTYAAGNDQAGETS